MAGMTPLKGLCLCLQHVSLTHGFPKRALCSNPRCPMLEYSRATATATPHFIPGRHITLSSNCWVQDGSTVCTCTCTCGPLSRCHLEDSVGVDELVGPPRAFSSYFSLNGSNGVWGRPPSAHAKDRYYSHATLG
ncbi:uncharacterized protein LY89DRAFT_678568 [Mollisia scopiformis]|uniref:Secreted protein n=1 Tax=Mollisia scopiformis TaxID=149040 RepID=A0A132B301_MOLSC|nr:uncharacterized protein LY89DRAFT_678568 [Mollisia scopiformis]KUJ06711.1 hypothetical protein LY89DRAFT_678568 [Mollisia scopiformis]